MIKCLTILVKDSLKETKLFYPTNTVQIPQMHKAFNYVTIKQKLKANLLQTDVWECA